VKPLLKFVLGVVVPLALLAALIISIGPRPGEPPPPVALETDPPTGESAVQLVGSLEGAWQVRQRDSFLGYRITEQYSRLYGTTEAVGRTNELEGTLVVADGEVVELEVGADLRTLESDQDNRDRVIRRRYLESERFPRARFVLTEPFRLDALRSPGETFSAAADGELTVRDVTRSVTFPVEAQLRGDVVQVVGSLAIQLSSFEVEAPDIPGYVSVEDDAAIEVNLVFERVDR
jgi:polyisoprenoid-binding protein YceI